MKQALITDKRSAQAQAKTKGKTKECSVVCDISIDISTTNKHKACFKRRILHASNSIVSIMLMLSATSETIKFDVFNCGRPKL